MGDTPSGVAGRGQLLLRCARLSPLAIIFVVVTLESLPALLSGDKLIPNGDFFQFAARHEAVRKSLLEYHEFPLRSHWFGGGYPTLGDPEDPALNPLVTLTIVFGAVLGLKLITYLALLVGGLGMYGFTRVALGYTRWGALFSGLVFGSALFVPMRVADGNPNEVYAAFIPLCLLLLSLARNGSRAALAALVGVLYTMLSDGKMTAIAGMTFMGIVCLIDCTPWSQALSSRPTAWRRRTLGLLIAAVALTACVGLARFLPAHELLSSHGGVKQMLPSHPKVYTPDWIYIYDVERLWRDVVSWKGSIGLVTIGWLPVVLSACALIAFPAQTWAWGLTMFVFAWLSIGYQAAPLDLLRVSWNLPILDTAYRPNKYYTFQIVFVLALLAGRSFALLERLRRRTLEGAVAITLIAVGLVTLYPKAAAIQRDTYTQAPPAGEGYSSAGFFQVSGRDLKRNRFGPPRSLSYFNLRQNVGTIDWYTGIPLSAYATPKLFVLSDDSYVANPDYRGEAYFLEGSASGSVIGTTDLSPNAVTLEVDVMAPGTLVINQNFHPDWRSDKGVVKPLDGLLALELRETGRYRVTLHYRGRRFFLGLVSSCVILAALWLAWGAGERRSRRRQAVAPL